LNEKPTDLSQLAQNNNGTFPTARVTRILDGSEAIAAHGSAQKPVWRHVFGAGEHAAGGNPEQTVARQRMQLILQVSRRHSREIEAHKVLEQTTIENPDCEGEVANPGAPRVVAGAQFAQVRACPISSTNAQRVQIATAWTSGATVLKVK
jgi:hypothetical protein